ncbi:dihydrodipicolinate synthase family protein [Anatilimnocola floriformis]|uniref:dihydrodipicolinate synthase family protein n=1 Tax=Anatilimnocola floriformis TaxID=2948575 RepID=UPI0020C2283C|nr:dihydrodipicolinate synthase family protein [Anatilimnocola floriformis]
MTKHPFTGVFPAITTQFRQDLSLDLEGTARHIEALVASGIQGLIVCGSLGENQTLDAEEKRRVVDLAVQVAGKKIPVLSGVAETSTNAACRYVKDCEALGANGFMVMPAMVYKADEPEVMNHFRRVAAATKLPWMLYNNPVGYYTDVTPRQFAELADVPNLVALKESSANTRRVTELRIECGDRFAIFTGVDDLVLESAVLGIDGWVAGSGIAFPNENQYFWELTRANKWHEARAMYQWFYPLLKLDTHLKFVQYIKLAVQETGLGAEWVREPRLPLVGQERERVLEIIHKGIAARPKLK